MIRPDNIKKTFWSKMHPHFERILMKMWANSEFVPFQSLSKVIFQDLTYQFSLVDIVDLQIINKDEIWPSGHVQIVLGRLQEHTPYISLKGCNFLKMRWLLLVCWLVGSWLWLIWKRWSFEDLAKSYSIRDSCIFITSTLWEIHAKALGLICAAYQFDNKREQIDQQEWASW